MNQFLKAKTMGLPRWAWALMLTGAVGVGLYLRTKSSAAETESESGERLSTYTGEEPGQLATAGLVGPASGTVTPVEAPYLPEGITDVTAQLAELASSLGATISNISESHWSTLPANELPAGVGLPTGGGAPTEPVSHTTPGAAESCPAGTVANMRQHKAEVVRLQGEIDALQNQIKQLSANIQAHPNAKQKSQWENERNAARSNINAKFVKVVQHNAAIATARAKPGCSKVQV